MTNNALRRAANLAIADGRTDLAARVLRLDDVLTDAKTELRRRGRRLPAIETRTRRPETDWKDAAVARSRKIAALTRRDHR